MLKINNPSVAIIILTHNDSTIVLKCIDSVIKSNYENCTIFLVDNGSDIDVTETIKGYYKDISFLRIVENLGYSGGLNFAIKYISKIKDYDYYWLLNNDLTVEEDVLEALVQVMEENITIGFVGCHLISLECTRLRLRSFEFICVHLISIELVHLTSLDLV